jgi:Ca-activated chloride channel family protein
MRELRLAIAISLLVPLVAVLHANSWFTGDMSLYEPGRGTLLFPLEKPGRYAPAQGLATKVSIQVTGILARTQVRQSFVNPSRDYQEGIYVFPLPPRAAVDTLKVIIGDRVIVGEIRTKQKARAAYQAAKAAGKKAALVEQARPDVFTTSVANIGPGEKVVVVIEYQERLSWRDGKFALRFPLTVSTRHDPGHQKASGDLAPIPEAPRVDSSEEGPTVALDVELDAGFLLSRVECTSHKLKIERPGPTKRRISLAESRVPADRDFVLTWEVVETEAPQAMLRMERRGEDVYVLLLVQPPRAEVAKSQRLPREILLVIDSSGSMEGSRMENARAAVLETMGRLHPEDRLNIIDFDSQARALWTSSQSVTPEHRAKAAAFVKEIQAGGGTNMGAALDLALGADSVPQLLRQVVFITDGQVNNESELFRIIRRKLDKSRLFTVGIGAAPNGFFMQRAARFGRGTFTQIDGEKQVAERMAALLRKLENPLVRDLQVTWQGETVEAWPAQIPDLYLGEPLMVVARLHKPGSLVTIQGVGGGTPFQATISLPKESRKGVARLWAREKIAGLSVQQVEGREAAGLKAELTKVALEYGLVSRYTSLVAVEKERSRPQEAPLKTRRIPNLRPKDVRPSPAPIQGVPEPEEWALLLLALGVLTHVALREGARQEGA